MHSHIQMFSDAPPVPSFCPPLCSQSIIYYLVHSPKLSTWLKDVAVQEALQSYTKWHHIERDPQVFSVKIDEDYVHCLQGVTRASFCNVYLEWVQYCAGKMETVFKQCCVLAAGWPHLLTTEVISLSVFSLKCLVCKDVHPPTV